MTDTNAGSLTNRGLTEAARVASECIIISGWWAGDNSVFSDPIVYQERMTAWDGETEDSESTSYHWDHGAVMVTDAGMVVDTLTRFLIDPDRWPNTTSWLIEARF